MLRRYTVVIFTNQAGVAKGHAKVLLTSCALCALSGGCAQVADLTGKVTDLMKEVGSSTAHEAPRTAQHAVRPQQCPCAGGQLGFPLYAFMACAEDTHRKPGPGMWNAMVSHGRTGQHANNQQRRARRRAAGVERC